MLIDKYLIERCFHSFCIRVIGHCIILLLILFLHFMFWGFAMHLIQHRFGICCKNQFVHIDSGSWSSKQSFWLEGRKEREREKEKGRREKKWREGSLEKQTDTSFGGEDNGVTNLTDGRKQEEDKPPSNQNTNGSSSCSFWNHFHSEELCAVG